MEKITLKIGADEISFVGKLESETDLKEVDTVTRTYTLANGGSVNEVINSGKRLIVYSE